MGCSTPAARAAFANGTRVKARSTPLVRITSKIAVTASSSKTTRHSDKVWCAVSYLPTAMPTDGTNFRAWKIYDNGNVFYANTGMDAGELPALTSDGTATLRDSYATSIAEFATVQVRESSNNPRSEAPITSGDIFEFEFGIFIEESAVRDGSRTSYYTDTFRYQVGVGGLTARSDDTNGEVGPVLEAQQGGNGTNVWLYEDQEFVFEQMALNIQHENAQPFLRGRRLFHTDFDSGEHSEGGNPVFDEQVGKLGPLFAAKRCETCHIHNGPGALLTNFDEDASMVFKLYDDSSLGGQLQLQEGEVQVSMSSGPMFTFPDGGSVALSKPTFEIDASSAGVEHFSARIARKVVGLGLLEAVAEEINLGARRSGGLQPRRHFGSAALLSPRSRIRAHIVGPFWVESREGQHSTPSARCSRR